MHTVPVPVSVSALDPAGQTAYRAALAGHVVEVLYHAWQRDLALTLAEIVNGVHALRPDAPTVEIHRAIGRLECSGLVEWAGDGRWRRNAGTEPGPGILESCPRAACLRAAGHDGGHLPDLGAEALEVELVVFHTDFLAVWPAGADAGYVRIYADGMDYLAGNDPVEWLTVPRNAPFVGETLIEVLADWISHRNGDTTAGRTA